MFGVLLFLVSGTVEALRLIFLSTDRIFQWLVISKPY